jgi:hypothetical protein
MRQLRPRFAVAIILIALIGSAGCKRKPQERASEPEPSAVLLSVANMGDPAAVVQLASGFFELEANTWRWTAGKFTVVLRPPEGAAERGARLELHFNLPPVVVDKIGPVTVSATVAGAGLPPETYAKTGDYVYTRDVDAAALRGSAVTIHFATDKVLPPAGVESRELALVATSVGLVAK